MPLRGPRLSSVTMRTPTASLPSLAAALLAGVVALVGGAPGAVAAPSQRAFRSPAHRVTSVEPPTGWERAAAPPSSRLLASWAHRDGARLTLAADRVPASADAKKLFEQSRSSLEKQGWAVGRVDAQPGRVLVEATIDKGKRVARQLYLVEGGLAYVLTLVSDAAEAPARAREFDETVASLKLGEDVPR
jgi:hypothetical protein